MTISAVGSPITDDHAYYYFSETVTASTIGNILVVFFSEQQAGITPTISGGPVASWNTVYSNAIGNTRAAMWWGVVNSLSPTSLSVVWGTGGGALAGLGIQEFSSSVAGTWSLDSFSSSAGVASSGNFISITPTGTNELYVGMVSNQDSGNNVTGSSAGFTYISPAGYGQRTGIYAYYLNASNPTVYGPNWSNGISVDYLTVSALLQISPPLAPFQQVLIV